MREKTDTSRKDIKASVPRTVQSGVGKGIGTEAAESSSLQKSLSLRSARPRRLTMAVYNILTIHEPIRIATASDKSSVIRVWGVPVAEELYQFRRGSQARICSLNLMSSGPYWH